MTEYYYQHQELGEVCVTFSPIPPSHRWFPISHMEYRDRLTLQAHNKR